VPLYAWIQTNATSSATSSIVWVKIDFSIGYNGNETIYILFYNTSVNNFNSVGYLGEAPQLSPQFNEYNNIALVMNPGLLIQFYTNSSVLYLRSLPSPSVVQNANITEGSTIIYSGNIYQAQITPYLSPFMGNQSEIYMDVNKYSDLYVPFATENNVIISYHTTVGDYPGTFPSPPIINTSYPQTWFAKAQGFVFMNQSTTTFYAMDDDGTYITLGNKGTYLNNNWGNGNVLINDYHGHTAFTPLSNATSLMGTQEISILYGEIGGGPALWQVWTSSPVEYYSPSPLHYLPTILFGHILVSGTSATVANTALSSTIHLLLYIYIIIPYIILFLWGEKAENYSPQPNVTVDRVLIKNLHIDSLKDAFHKLFYGAIISIFLLLGTHSVLIMYAAYFYLIKSFGNISRSSLPHAQQYANTRKWLLAEFILSIISVISIIVFFTHGIVIIGITIEYIYIIITYIAYLKLINSLKSLSIDIQVKELYDSGNYLYYSLPYSITAMSFVPAILFITAPSYLIFSIPGLPIDFLFGIHLKNKLNALILPIVFQEISFVLKIKSYHLAYKGLNDLTFS
jgi:hypothetical protein